MEDERHGVSVIIPAHNESAVIERCLRSLVNGNEREIEIIVACNGCTDGTEQIAEAFDPRVRVVLSDVASKHAALNLGDRSATQPIRCYVDADVELSDGALDAVAAHLESGAALATAPQIRFEPAGSRLAKAYLRTWEANPYFRQGLIGSGFYAMGPEGRARFEQFPPIVTDDMFVHGLFADHERTITPDATFVPLMPETLRAILSVHLRHFGAHKEFEQWAAETGASVVLPSVGGPGWLLGQWRNPLGVATYLVVKVAAQVGGRLKYRFGDMQNWNRGR